MYLGTKNALKEEEERVEAWETKKESKAWERYQLLVYLTFCYVLKHRLKVTRLRLFFCKKKVVKHLKYLIQAIELRSSEVLLFSHILFLMAKYLMGYKKTQINKYC